MGVVAMSQLFKSFSQIEAAVLTSVKASGKRPRIALACAQDPDGLAAVVDAHRRGVVDAVLIGDVESISSQLFAAGENEAEYELLACDDEREAARMAVAMVRAGEADIPMKGLMMTASFMRAILDKETGLLPEGNLLSQATVLEWPARDKLMVISDCAVNIAPDLGQKAKICRNAIDLAHVLGYERPNVGVISALEVVNPKIQSTVDAAAIADMDWPDACVGGPFALDNAVVPEAAALKGVTHPAAGKCDVLIVPDLPSGNIFTKSLTFFAQLKSAGSLNGTTSPVVMTSRTDTPKDKYFSILVAIAKTL